MLFASLTSVEGGLSRLPSVLPLISLIVYAEHIFMVAAPGVALVVIDGNQRVFRSFGDTSGAGQ